MPAVTLILGMVLACLVPCQNEVSCEIKVADCLLKAGRAREAIKRLKPLAAKHPACARLLARAYLADNNPAWAQKTLKQALARDPGDCQSRSWLAWVHIGQGFLDLAKETLEQPGCPVSEADKTRWLLLQSYLARMEEKSAEAGKLLQQVAEADLMYQEDQELLSILRGQVDPGWIAPLHLRVDLSLGYTSNAAADSRIDPYSPPDPPGSPLARVELYGRLVWPTRSSVRPVFDADLRGHGMTAGGAEDLSYLEISGRPGVLIGRDFPRLLLGYRHDGLFLNQGIQPYYKGHRLEAELETAHMTAFAGAGRRMFNEDARTRLELDGGAGFHFLAGKRVRFLLVGSVRYYLADKSHYDQFGGSGLAVARIDIGSGYSARLGVVGGIDYYPNSGGEFGIKDNRLDLLATLSAGFWSPSLHGIRLGIVYDLAWRDSSADIFERDYDYVEHRVLFKTTMAFDFSPGAPDTVAGQDHVPLGYGIDEDAAGLFEEKIQDLVRQDELFRRGSCGCAQ
jgi:tetratricopeptide (TPR) repeat protein